VVSLPTAFTPNGDGVNDTWRPAYTDSVETMEVKLYDMQAQLVFDSKELYFAWNGLDKKGRPCAVGEYLFTVQYRYKGTLQRMKGALLLLR
jgi:gliding motility-associated-like protein